ncbi:MAG: hypothetical protein ACREOG_18565 [Gemmatimonadaceae bacterium]
MSKLQLYLFVALGVAVSIILPLIRAFLPKPKKDPNIKWRDRAKELWLKIRPYVATAIFSLIVAALLMAAFGDKITTWQAALIAGYGFDSTLQKLSTGNTGVE